MSYQKWGFGIIVVTTLAHIATQNLLLALVLTSGIVFVYKMVQKYSPPVLSRLTPVKPASYYYTPPSTIPSPQRSVVTPLQGEETPIAATNYETVENDEGMLLIIPPQ